MQQSRFEMIDLRNVCLFGLFRRFFSTVAFSNQSSAFDVGGGGMLPWQSHISRNS